MNIAESFYSSLTSFMVSVETVENDYFSNQYRLLWETYAFSFDNDL